MPIEWDRTKDEVLRENTAQAIHQELEKLDNQKEKYERRWIWELFQNAVDATPQNGKVNIRLQLNGRFLFEHDGLPFSTKEILHLIFHGSTKREQQDRIGRYGTGFLSTHIVSRKVRVRGVLESEGSFHIVLDRSGNSPQELADSMEVSERMLRESLTKCPDPENLRTSFEYELSESTRRIVETAFSDLHTVAPIVLAFDKRINTLRIEAGDTTHFVVRRAPLFEGAQLVEICMPPSEQAFSTLVVVEDDDVSVAMPIVRKDDRLALTSTKGLPHLFVAFPLLGTEALPFPFLANCLKGKPTDGRDGLYLGIEDSGDNRSNKEYVEKCWQLFSSLVRYASEQLWDNLAVAAEVGTGPEADWLDKSWIDGLSRQFLREIIVQTPLVPTDAGQAKTPKDVLFPTIESGEKLEQHRSLVRAAFGENVPNAGAVRDWQRVILQWQGLSDLEQLEIKTISLNHLARKASSLKTLENVATTLSANGRSEFSAVDWLNSFLTIVLDCSEQNLLDTLPLLPNQIGVLAGRKELSQDDNIDEALKDIAHQLGNGIREKLLDARIDPCVQSLLPPYSQETLVSGLLKLVISKARKEYHTDSYREANAAFFGWLGSARRLGELESYPLISAHKDHGNAEVLVEERGRLLAPVDFWVPEAREFFDLFPAQSILSPIYVSHLTSDTLQWLKGVGFFRCDPLLKEVSRLGTGDVAALIEKPLLAEQEDVEHEVRDIEVMDIAFLSVKDRGLMDTVRGSRSKGAEFLAFILNYILPQTASYLQYEPFQCSCGQSHNLQRALWLPTIKERSWVYERKGRSSPPTAQNLARLWQDNPSLKNRLEDDAVLLFLERLGISASEIMLSLSGSDSHEMQRAIVMLLNASRNDPLQVQKVAEILASDLALIEEFEKRKERRARTKLNQQLGALVEDLFRELFESPEIKNLGFRIKRTHIGSDFAIEHDFIEDNQEFALQVESPKGRYLIEIKSTYDVSISMTHTQAGKAVVNSGSFALCVVPLLAPPIDAEAVRRDARFVIEIGDLLRKQVDMVSQLHQVQSQAAMKVGNIEVVIESGEIRYRIRSPAWESGLTFDAFVQFLVDRYRSPDSSPTERDRK